MFRAGLYARVSTNDQQTIPLQIRALREYAVRRGWTIAMQIKEFGSGASQRQQREKLLDAARRRDVDVVLVWRLDRWGRSVADLLATLQELRHLGVGFVSLTEALDLTTPAGRAMAALLAVFAEFEREILREGCAPDWPMPGGTARDWVGPLPRDSTPTKCVRCTAPTLARPRSPASCRSGVPRCAVFWRSHSLDCREAQRNLSRALLLGNSSIGRLFFTRSYAANHIRIHEIGVMASQRSQENAANPILAGWVQAQRADTRIIRTEHNHWLIPIHFISVCTSMG
jgi:Resolvase, N terminal domain